MIFIDLQYNKYVVTKTVSSPNTKALLNLKFSLFKISFLNNLAQGVLKNTVSIFNERKLPKSAFLICLLSAHKDSN